MNISPIIFFDMVAAILILAIALIAIIFYLSRITKNLHDLSNSEAFQNNADLLEEARTKALKTIDDANNQALDIVNKVTLSTDISSENFKQDLSRISSAQIKELEKATGDFTATYSQTLQELKTKNIELFQNISKDIETSATEEIQNFKDSMQKLTVLSQKEVERKISTEYDMARKETENYKKEELQKIDSGIFELLEKISKLVLGKALGLSEHESLIEESLAKAKKEGIFK